MAKPNVADPSMEDILASIRRIIADDEPQPAAAEAVPPSASASPPLAFPSPAPRSEEVLDLGGTEEDMEAVEPKPIDPVDTDDISFDAPAAFTPASVPPSPQSAGNGWNETAKPAAPYPTQSGLISAHTDTAVSAAFTSLASAIFSAEPRTIEDLTKDLLRPLLKQWLDENLPTMVERLVRDEIERVARGRRY